MTRISTFLGVTLAVGGLLTIGSASVHAQDDDVEGIIRISDCVNGGAAAASCNTCPQGNCQTCPSGGCPSGCGRACGHGCGRGCGRGCGHGCFHCCGHIHHFLAWLDPHGPCTVSPDHGWSPPAKQALWRRSVAYNKFFPDGWTGAPAAAPVTRVGHVYMPTDTTQLGYYYQHVPYWQPNWAMIPSAPNPLQWHRPLCGNGMCGYGGEVINGGAGCPQVAGEPSVAPNPPAVVDNAEADLQKSDTPALQPTP
jgi:hypothetical protein